MNINYRKKFIENYYNEFIYVCNLSTESKKREREMNKKEIEIYILFSLFDYVLDFYY